MTSTEPSLMRRRSRRGLSYTRRGTGPTVVFIHGWCLSGEMWLYQETMLASTCTVIVPDLAGFGASDDLAGAISAQRHAADLEDLLEELELPSAHVVGFAYGAMVAMNWAATSPERIASLVLIGVPSAARAPYEKMPRAIMRDWPTFATRSAAGICKEGTSPATLEWLARIFVRTPLASALAGVEELGRWEPLDRAGNIPSRTVVVHGSQDQVVSVDVAHALTSALPRAELLVIDGAAHLVPIDASQDLGSLIADVAAT
jgi:pimeloyl-ACP methyl ester carboxylesterase